MSPPLGVFSLLGSDYPYLRAWSRYRGLDVEDQMMLIRRARREAAPPDACWYSDDLRGWMTRSMLVERALRSDLAIYNLNKLDEYAEFAQQAEPYPTRRF